ncbi:MAG: hypothetical protein U1E76_19550 [Planctomycetota bacterium]
MSTIVGGSLVRSCAVPLALLLAACGGGGGGGGGGAGQQGGKFKLADGGPRFSSAAGLSGDDKTLVVVNSDSDTISIFDASTDTPVKLGEVGVGSDPRGVAVMPDGSKVYVANANGGKVAVVSLGNRAVLTKIKVGSEPRALVLTPNGSRLFVANELSDSVSVIDTKTDKVITTIDIPADSGSHPRALAVTNDGDADDLDEKVFVAMFLAVPRAGKTGFDEGQDDSREGRLVAISTATNQLAGKVVLAPLGDSGFKSNGSVLDFVGTSNGAGGVDAPDPKNPEDVSFATGCFPNQLADIAIHPRNGLAYVVSTAAAPNGPVKFNVNAQGLVSVFDTRNRKEVVSGNTGSTVFQKAPLNLDQGLKNDTATTPVIFLTNPVAMAWRPDGSEAWIAVQTGNLLVRLTVDDQGIPTINAPQASGGASIVRIDLEQPGKGKLAGKAPRAIVINRAGTRGYVYNFVSRSVSVIDLDARKVVGTVQSSPLPAAGTNEAAVQLGAELFFGGRGPNDRMSSEAWGTCTVCHPDGLADGVTWMFDGGPRQTIPLDGMFNRTNTHDQRVLNWSAVRDENQDFELNTRGVFGGRGLIEDDRPLFAIGGASGATPADSSAIVQYHQFLNKSGTTNVLAGDAALPQILSARRDFALATLPDGRIFIIGGRSGAGNGTLVGAQDAVLEFDPFANEVRRKSSTGFTLRHSLGAAAVQTATGLRIYAMGGYDSTNDVKPNTKVEEYNPSNDTWTTETSMPLPLAQFGVVAVNAINKAEADATIHVLGGNTFTDANPTVSGAVLRFLPDATGAGVWSTLAVTITPRRNLGAAAIVRGAATHVFGIGGRDGTGAALATVEEYKVVDATVLVTPITQLSSGLHSFGIGTSSNRIYLAGGQDGNGADLGSVLEFNPAANPTGGQAGDPGEPSGVVTTKAPLPVAVRSLQLSTPPAVANFLPVASSERDARQDAINEWIKAKVRSFFAPNRGADVSAGRNLFGTEGLTGIANTSCATCHGGPKWTRSIVDYKAPPSPDLVHGDQEINGAELTKTATQPGDSAATGVLIDVGTFVAYDPVAKTGRVNETRPDPADVGRRIAALGAKGFNIPSLLSVAGTAPYFHNGMAATLLDVLDGTLDGQGASQLRSVHFVSDAADRAALVEFLKSIDETTPAFP